jgi:hypothetical protein
MSDVTYWLTKVGRTLIAASEPIKDLGEAVSELSGILANLSSSDRTLDLESNTNTGNRLKEKQKG